MIRIKWLFYSFVHGLILFVLIAGCTSQHVLKDHELKKLDPVLRSVVLNGSHPGPIYDVKTHEDGTLLLGVVIRTTDMERLRRSDVPLLATGGGTATAQLTVEQIKEAVRVRGVQYIELGTTISPQ